MSGETDDEDPLENGDKDRLERVRGKRDQRPSRRRGRSSTQAEQAPQAEQGKQAQQEGDDDEENQQSESAQAKQAPVGKQADTAEGSEQAPQAQQEEQEKLEPVTQREHDTFYLSSEVRSELNRIYRRVSLNVLEETDVDIDDQAIGGRNRYFRPLALLLGARELESMSSDELREAIEDEDLVDDLPTADE